MSIIKDLNDGVNNLVKLLTDALVPSSKKTTSSEESRNKLQNMNTSDKSSSAVKSAASSIANAINNAQSSLKSNIASAANKLINSGSKSTDKQLEDALISGINGKTYLPSIKTPTYQDLVKQTPDTLKSNAASKINTIVQSNSGYTQKQLEDALISGINGKSYTPVSNTKRTTYEDLVRDTKNISNANNKSNFDFYSNLENIAEQLSSNINFSTALNKKNFWPYFKEYIKKQLGLDFEGNNKYNNNKENSDTDEQKFTDSRANNRFGKTGADSSTNSTGAKNNGKTIYNGNIWMNGFESDMLYADTSKKDLMKVLSPLSIIKGEKAHLNTWKSLVKLLSNSETEPILMDMIDHFENGRGADYSNKNLTHIVENQPATQKYMSDFTDVFQTFMGIYKGDYNAFAESQEFKDALKKQGVYISKYAYGGGLFDKDTWGGLTMAIHSWTESNVEVIDYYTIGNQYYGTLQFTFIDNFGLDYEDLQEYGFIPGFESWYALQHDKSYGEKYQPFKTVVTLNYEFKGSF